MAKKVIASYSVIPSVSCDGCIYKINDDGLVMWCNKIKMPLASKKNKQCIYKS